MMKHLITILFFSLQYIQAFTQVDAHEALYPNNIEIGTAHKTISYTGINLDFYRSIKLSKGINNYGKSSNYLTLAKGLPNKSIRGCLWPGNEKSQVSELLKISPKEFNSQGYLQGLNFKATPTSIGADILHMFLPSLLGY
jgi:hypothetical protein